MTQLRLRALIKGVATFAPGGVDLACRGSGGTLSARYCYAVWLRHLVRAAEVGGNTAPVCVAELGPGDSLGVGIAAILSGADHYWALDAKAHARRAENVRVFEELVDLFSRRTPIPDNGEFPEMMPTLRDYAFPANVLTRDRMARALAPARLNAVRTALVSEDGSAAAIRVRYAAPWHAVTVADPDMADFAFSQAVLEHVEKIDLAYRALFRWIRPGGFMSHTIDFRSHGLTRAWNGHWTVSDPIWALVKGRRPYLINRQPHTAHLDTVRSVGFQVVTDEKYHAEPLARAALARRFRELSDTDLSTRSAFLQALRPA